MDDDGTLITYNTSIPLKDVIIIYYLHVAVIQEILLQTPHKSLNIFNSTHTKIYRYNGESILSCSTWSCIQFTNDIVR